jgi:hypothetical protein
MSVPEFGLSKHQKAAAAWALLMFALGTVYGFIVLALVVHETARGICWLGQ